MSSRMAVAIGASALLSSAATFAALNGDHRHPALARSADAPAVAPPVTRAAVSTATFRDASVPAASSVVMVPGAGAAVECF